MGGEEWDEISLWVDEQIRQNDPRIAGVPGAERLARALITLSSAKPTAFGMFQEVSRSQELLGRARAMFDHWLTSATAEQQLEMAQALVPGSLECVGIDLWTAHPSRRPVTHRVIVEYPVSVSHDSGEQIRDPQLLKHWDGVSPVEYLSVPHESFEHFSWFVDAELSLRFVPATGVLICQLCLDASSKPTSHDLESLETGTALDLWETNWACNIDWDEPDECGDDHAPPYVAAEVLSVRVAEALSP